MSYEFRLRGDVVVGSKAVQVAIEELASGRNGVEETIADGQTDYQINFDVDVSALQALLIKSDQDISVETNDGTSPDDTINVKAGVPIIWFNLAGWNGDNPLTADVTDLYVTNASGEEAKLEIEAIQDATP